jgi:hypothetical protein
MTRSRQPVGAPAAGHPSIRPISTVSGPSKMIRSHRRTNASRWVSILIGVLR